MLYKFVFYIFLLLKNNSYGFSNNHIVYNINKLRMTNHNDMINYLTSIKDYTVITKCEKNRNLEELLHKKNIQVYYVNIENLLDSREILEFLQKKYNNINGIEYTWIFYKGHFFGSIQDIYDKINKKYF